MASLDSARVERLLHAARREQGIPALAAVVARSDTVLGAVAVGVRRLGREAPVRVGDAFHLGSLTKAVTATTIATLVEEGSLSWSSRTVDVFPEWADSIHPALRGVTIDQLLRHTSGLAPYEDTSSPSFRSLPPMPQGPEAQRRAFAGHVLRQAPPQPPGARYAYSNAGYAVAAAMAERATGRPWEALVRERVFRPLGMSSAGFGWPAQPWGHTEVEGGMEPLDPGGEMQLPLWHRPAGDVFASVADYARFMQAHLRGLRGEDGLLRAATVRHLHTPGGEHPSALGWGVRNVDGVRTSMHTGGTGVFYAVVALQPSRDLAVAVFGTSDRETDERAVNEILRALLQAPESPR